MHDMLCSSWLVDFLEFETEYQSISGRLIGDIEAVHCVSYPFLLFLVHIIRLLGCAGCTIFA